MDAGHFYPAIEHCMKSHPILCAAIKDAETEKPSFVRPMHLELKNHVRILAPMAGDSNADEDDAVKQAIIDCHDRFFQHSDGVPHWDVTIVRLASKAKPETRLLVLFSFSHSHGDGTSGLAFHRTFLDGLRRIPQLASDRNRDSVVDTPANSLLPSMENATNLTISWKYLLGVLVAPKLPRFLNDWLGLSPLSPATTKTWLGNSISYTPGDHRTSLEVLTIPSGQVVELLERCREHGARLTALLHQLVVYSLRQALPQYSSSPANPELVATTPLNLRHLIAKWASSADMANAVSAVHELFSPTLEPNESFDVETIWAKARESGSKMATSASTLQNQPVGLLHYVSAFRPFFTDQLGKPRDASYEISNIGSFDPAGTFAKDSECEFVPAVKPGNSWDIDTMFFSQPANVAGATLCYSVVSRKGGDLVICESWQSGVLGVSDETAFAKSILRCIELALGRLLQA